MVSVLLSNPLLLGLALGVKHAFEPDHLAAISTMVTRSTSVRAAASTGAAWGVGHGGSIVVFGGVLIAMGVRVPPSVAMVLDLAVAVVLVALGIQALLRVRRRDRELDRDVHPHEHRRAAKRSTLVGFVHGASGTAAITIVCLTTFPSSTQAVGFLVLFSLGALVSMSALSGLLARPLSALVRRGKTGARALDVASGVLALVAAIAVTIAAFHTTA